jgi:hypothetical protein
MKIPLVALLIALSTSAALNAEDIKTTTGREYKNASVSRAEPDGLVISFSAGIVKIPFTELPAELREKYHYDSQAAAAAYQKEEDIKTTTGQEYKNVTVRRVEPDGLAIAFSAGIVKIPFTELSPDLREKYHYDPEAAAAYQKEAEEAAQKWAQSVAEARESARQVNQSAASAATASPTPQPTVARGSDEEHPLSTVEPADNLNTIPIYTPQRFQASKLNLMGRIVRVTFTVRSDDPQESSDGESYTGWLGDGSGNDVTVRFPATRLGWFRNIASDYYRTRGLVPVTVYGRVIKDRYRNVVFDLIGTDIVTDGYGRHINWR